MAAPMRNGPYLFLKLTLNLSPILINPYPKPNPSLIPKFDKKCLKRNRLAVYGKRMICEFQDITGWGICKQGRNRPWVFPHGVTTFSSSFTSGKHECSMENTKNITPVFNL